MLTNKQLHFSWKKEETAYPTLTRYGLGDGWYSGVEIRGGKWVGPAIMYLFVVYSFYKPNVSEYM